MRHRALERPVQPAEQRGEGGAVVHPDHEQGKFVPTEAGSHVAAAQGSPELGANSLERHSRRRRGRSGR